MSKPGGFRVGGKVRNAKVPNRVRALPIAEDPSHELLVHLLHSLTAPRSNRVRLAVGGSTLTDCPHVLGLDEEITPHGGVCVCSHTQSVRTKS